MARWMGEQVDGWVVGQNMLAKSKKSCSPFLYCFTILMRDIRRCMGSPLRVPHRILGLVFQSRGEGFWLSHIKNVKMGKPTEGESSRKPTSKYNCISLPVFSSLNLETQSHVMNND